MPTRREGQQRYEELRLEVLEGRSGFVPGLTVFLRRGMTSWLEVLASWAVDTPSPGPAVAQPCMQLPHGAKDEIVHALAGMILGRECVERA